MECHDRTATVAGAAGNGTGRSIALTLARELAKVVVNYLTSAGSASASVNHIEGRGGQAVAIQADAASLDRCRDLADVAVTEFGQVDICIVNPGGGWHPEPVEKLDPLGALDDVLREMALLAVRSIHHHRLPIAILVPLGIIPLSSLECRTPSLRSAMVVSSGYDRL